MNEHNVREHEERLRREAEREHRQGADNEHNRREHEEAERRKQGR